MKDHIHPNFVQKLFCKLFFQLPFGKPSIILEVDGIQIFTSVPNLTDKILWSDIKEILFYHTGIVKSRTYMLVYLIEPQKYFPQGIDALTKAAMPELSEDMLVEPIFTIPSLSEFKETLKKYPVVVKEKDWLDKN